MAITALNIVCLFLLSLFFFNRVPFAAQAGLKFVVIFLCSTSQSQGWAPMLICLCVLAIFKDFKIHVCLCLCPWIQVPVKAKEAPNGAWAGVTGTGELPDLGAGSELWSSAKTVWVLKHQAVLRIESSLQLHCVLSWNCWFSLYHWRVRKLVH